MTHNLAALKKANSLERLSQQIDKFSSKGSQRNADPRFWQPAADKAGNGNATIRFLPAPFADGEDGTAFVRLFHHAFQGDTGAWYIENSRTTLGDKDPVSEDNTRLWNIGTEASQALARKRKRKATFIANILVVADEAHPENEGKVFLYKFGAKLLEKIKAVMGPAEGEQPDPDETYFDPCSFWEGANFKLKFRMVAGFRNYDQSKFGNPSPVSKDDAVIDKIWRSQYSLQEFLKPENFKSYKELKERFIQVVGLETGDITDTTEEDDVPWHTTETKPATAVTKKGNSKQSNKVVVNEEEAAEVVAPDNSEDEDSAINMSVFQKLAEED